MADPSGTQQGVQIVTAAEDVVIDRLVGMGDDHVRDGRRRSDYCLHDDLRGRSAAPEQAAATTAGIIGGVPVEVTGIGPRRLRTPTARNCSRRSGHGGHRGHAGGHPDGRDVGGGRAAAGGLGP